MELSTVRKSFADPFSYYGGTEPLILCEQEGMDGCSHLQIVEC